MNYFDPAGSYGIVTLLSPAAVTTSGNATGVDMLGYAGNAKVILSCTAGSGTSPTLDLKLQDSADNSTFADISGAAFTQVTDAAASVEAISVNLNSAARYIRVVKTAGGTTPSFVPSIVAVVASEQRV